MFPDPGDFWKVIQDGELSPLDFFFSPLRSYRASGRGVVVWMIMYAGC